MRLTMKKKKEKKEKFDYENFVPPDGGFGWVRYTIITLLLLIHQFFVRLTRHVGK